MHTHTPRIHPALLASLLTAFSNLAHATPATPAAPAAQPADAPNRITLSWPAVPGATSYKVSVLDSVTGEFGAPITVSVPNYTTGVLTAGRPVSFIVAAVDASGESAPSRDFIAQPVTLRDNVDGTANGVTLSGSWQNSSVAGYYGTNSSYAAPVAGATPSATCTFSGNLPVAGTYDVYLRWNAFSNRATNTPVDIKSGSTVLSTLLIDQTTNGGQWVKIGTHNLPAGSGTGTASVVIRNNGANGYVIADAVQFVLRTFDSTADYSLTKLADDFNGAALDSAVWTSFAGRTNVVVSGGRLQTRLNYKTTDPTTSQQLVVADDALDQADVAANPNAPRRLYEEANWKEGGIIARHAQKFGYHEARFLLPVAAARGVDTAYWHAATDEIIHGYEIDAPEFFNKDSSGVANNFGFGNWDHVVPTIQRINPDTNKLLSLGRTWDYERKTSTIGALDRYVTIGLEWRTDNVQVVYINGVKVHTAPVSGMNDIESILPANIILSTKVLDWLRPNVALNNSKALWDYARYYQKPGFTGAIDSDWANPANWGSDGRPAPGVAAVFNLATAPASISVPADQTLHSLFLDHPDLPAHIFTGTGALRLGGSLPGDTSNTHGGILVNTTVTRNQTFTTPLVGLENLQFANLSRTAGVTLALNGTISGDGLAPRDVDFLSPISANATLGPITLGAPLGSGLRHINRAGDCLFQLPAGNQHTGELRISRGPVALSDLSALGHTAASAVEFGPRYQHSDSWRPRLTYSGPAASSAHPIRLGGWAADGILECSGSGPQFGPLTWAGDLIISPSAGTPKQVLTRAPRFTLGGSYTGADNVFAGDISDAGVVVSYLNADNTPNTGPAALSLFKSGASTWLLSGNLSVSSPVTVSGGKLHLAPNASATVSVPAVIVSTGAEFGFAGTGVVTFSAPISGNGRLLQRGTGVTTLTAASTYAGNTTVSNGRLVVGSGTTGSITSASVIVSSGAEIAFGRDDNTTVTSLISGAGGLRKLGAGTLTLAGNNTFSGPVTVESGTLLRNNSGSGNLTVLGGTFDLNSGNRSAATVTVDGGSIVNSTGSSAQYLNTATLYDLRSGSISARLAGTASLVKSTTGTVFLTGNNTFTGGTVIQAGILDLDGPGTLVGNVTVSGGAYLVHSSATSTTPVTVQNGGAFQNWGLTIGSVSVESGGAFRNHGSIQGSVTLSAGATADAIGSVSGDLVNAGTITLTGNAPFSVAGSITNTGVIDASTWLGNLPANIAGAGTVIQPKPLTVSLNAPLGGVAALSGFNNQVQLTVTPDGIAPISVAWSQVSGPSGGNASFSPADTASTTASFSTSGLYVLRATVTDARAGRSTSSDVSVIHNPYQSLSLRSGVNGYNHTATFLRADTSNWNSGARDQMLVGKTTAAFRPVFSFDLSTLPNRPALASVSLDLWTAAIGSGAVGELQLRKLLLTPVEGNGDGVSPSSGADSGATWLKYDQTQAWSTPGGDFDSTALSTIPGFAPTAANVLKTFDLTAELATAAQDAIDDNLPLDLIITSPSTESGANNNFVRFASDDHATVAQRPRLNFLLTPGVPTPWSNLDVGSTGMIGGASALGTAPSFTYTVSGAGINIGSNADAFHFAHQPASGDCQIVARVAALERVNGNAKAGLMLRATTAADSRNVFLGLSADGWLNFHVRTATGSTTTHAVSPLNGQRAPLWLRLTRTGDTYTAARSADGVNWTTVGSATFTGMPADTLAGLAVTSRVAGTLGTAAFTDPVVTP